MSCYFRHLNEILKEAGIEVTSGNRKEVDRALHQLAGVEYENCPATWKRLKQEFLSSELKRKELALKLRNAFR